MPAAPVHNQAGAAVLFLCQFCLQQNTNLDSFVESGLLVISTEPTYWVDNPIHIPPFHDVHQAVEFVEVRLYLFVIVRIAIVVTFVERGQNRIPSPLLGSLD